MVFYQEHNLKFKTLLLLITSLFCQLAFSADATEIYKSAMKKSAAPIVDYSSSCTTCLEANLAKPKVKLESKENNQSIDLTLLSEKEAQNLFKEMAANKDIPFDFPFDGCYARAHTMTQIMEKKGIISGKAWVEGNLNVTSAEWGEVQWRYHVAPVVMVKVGNKNVPYVIDPSIMDKPVPFETWKNKMTSSKGSSKSSEYFTSRFNYDPDEKDMKKTAYDDELIEDAIQTNQHYKQILEQARLEKSKKAK
jgi:hypothetical protein